MATYKEIKGTQIEVLESDPSNPVEGQVWYNSTSNVLKGQAATTVGAWATGGALNTARQGLRGSGIQTAALAVGGQGGGPTNELQQITELYNGSSWTEVNNPNLARSFAGASGTQTSTLYFGGSAPTTAATESWNGTNWTTVNSLNTARNSLGGAGADNTSALAFGGSTNATESWNGTNWTEVNDLNTSRTGLGSNGIKDAALGFGGEAPPGRQTATEQWNGTNWTEVNNLNTAVATGAGSGLYTDGLSFGGETGPGVTANTELWNGTNWTEVNNLSAVRRQIAGTTGTGSSSALAFGGETPGISAVTDEWTGAGAGVTRTFTDS
jgi:hypothetical protein